MTAPLYASGTSRWWRKMRMRAPCSAFARRRHDQGLALDHRNVLHLADAVEHHAALFGIHLAHRARRYDRVADADGRFEASGCAHEDRARSRYLHAEHGRDVGCAQHPVRDAPLEDRALCVLLVEMNRILIAAHLTKELHVALRHGLREALFHSRFQFVDVVGHAFIPLFTESVSIGPGLHQTSVRIAARARTPWRLRSSPRCS